MVTYQRKYLYKVKNLGTKGSARMKLRLPDSEDLKPTTEAKEEDLKLGVCIVL